MHHSSLKNRIITSQITLTFYSILWIQLLQNLLMRFQQINCCVSHSLIQKIAFIRLDLLLIKYILFQRACSNFYLLQRCLLDFKNIDVIIQYESLHRLMIKILFLLSHCCIKFRNELRVLVLNLTVQDLSVFLLSLPFQI